MSRFMKVTTEMFRQEGPKAFYKGILPRVMRVAPGQAIVFTVRRIPLVANASRCAMLNPPLFSLSVFDAAAGLRTSQGNHG